MLLSAEDRHLLGSLVGGDVEQLVWDINAIYFVQRGRTLKVEALADRPPAPDAERFDEAAYLSVSVPDAAGPFRAEGEEGYWYRVVAERVRVSRIEVVRSYVGTPGSWTIRPQDRSTTTKTVTPVDCGLLITTSAGVAPAVQLGQSFGFAQWPDVRMHTRDEVLAVLGDDYDILPLEEAAPGKGAI